MAEKRPIIVIKKKGGHGGHHGGAWKVAYADFVTAMMALFIVLWLLNSSVKVKKAVAGYFQDPTSSQKETGSDMLGDAESLPIDANNVQKLKEQIQKAILDQKDLSKLAKNVEITITPEGLRIELMEDKNGTFFQSGSAVLSTPGQQLLGMLAGQLKALPNHLLLEGHTDAQPYSSSATYTNWELSADRANAARRLLQSVGVRTDQVSQVRGYADQLLRVKNNPLDPSNRRISLIVQWVKVDKPATKAEGGESATKPAGPLTKPAAATTNTATNTAATPKATAATTPTTRPVAAKPSPANNNILDRLRAVMPGKTK